MKYFQYLFALTLVSTLICPTTLLADEAFVVLEYHSSTNSRGTNSESYLVQPGDTLAGIVGQHYGHVPNQQELFRQIVEQNPRAFLGGNPNRLLSGVTLSLSGAGSASENNRDEIYFF